MLDFGGGLGEGWSSWALRDNPGFGGLAVYRPVVHIQFVSIRVSWLKICLLRGVWGHQVWEVGSMALCEAGMGADSDRVSLIWALPGPGAGRPGSPDEALALWGP